jgi:cholesterol transport system auxiliary component
MSARHFFLSVSAALVLAGCSIGKPVPQTTTNVVELSMPAGNAVTRLPGPLRIGNVRVAAAFSGNSLIYRMDDVNYVSDPNQAFIADPASMLGNEMATWLDRSRAFKSVTQPGSTQSAQYVLEATVIELYGDFRSGKQPAAVVKVQFVLLNYSGTLPSVVYEGTIGRREPLERVSPDILVRGYGTALSEILSQFVSELGARKIRLKAGRVGGGCTPTACEISCRCRAIVTLL